MSDPETPLTALEWAFLATMRPHAIARALEIPPRRVRHWIKHGQLRYTRDASGYLVNLEDAMELVPGCNKPRVRGKALEDLGLLERVSEAADQ